MSGSRHPARFRLPLLAGILLLCTIPASAQEYTITRQILLPPTFYVGDPVEMRLFLRTTSDVQLTAPKTLPQGRFVTFQSIEVEPSVPGQEQDREVRISLVVFRPGTEPLPPIDLGGVVLRDLNVYVKSAIPESGADLRPAQGQLLLPNTRLVIGVIVGVALVVPLVWFVFVRFGRARLNAFVARLREQQPYRRLMKALKGLSPRTSEPDGRQFYIELLDAVRTYFTNSFGADFSTLTTSELSAQFPRGVFTDVERKQIIDLFQYADLIKFAGRTAPERARQSHIETIQITATAAIKRRNRPTDEPAADQPELQLQNEQTDDRSEGRRDRARLIRKRVYVSTFVREDAPKRRVESRRDSAEVKRER